MRGAIQWAFTVNCDLTTEQRVYQQNPTFSDFPPDPQNGRSSRGKAKNHQNTAESPERDVQLADDILPILAYGPRELGQPYSAANRGRTNKRHPTCKGPVRCHVAWPKRS